MQTAVLVYIEIVNTIWAVEKYSSTLLTSLVITCDFVVPYYHFWIPARYWKLRILEPNACELLIATHCSHWPCPRPIQGLSRGLAVIPLLAVKARKKDCAAQLPLHSTPPPAQHGAASSRSMGALSHWNNWLLQEHEEGTEACLTIQNCS